MKTPKTITSKSVQTKVANSIKADMEKAMSIFTYHDKVEYDVVINESSSTYKEVVVTSNFMLHNLYPAALTSLQEVMGRYEKKYDVYYSIEVRPLMKYENDEVKWDYIPAFVAVVGRQEA